MKGFDEGYKGSFHRNAGVVRVTKVASRQDTKARQPARAPLPLRGKKRRRLLLYPPRPYLSVRWR